MNDIQRAFITLYTYDLRNQFARALKKGLVGANKEIRDFAVRLQDDNFGNKADAAVEFGKVATDMHAALLEAYATQVEARKVVDSYRKGDDRLAGALLETLRDETMVTADGEGITYLNRTLLDEQARHWRRLNFGAEGHRAYNVTGAPQPVRFDERILFYAGSAGTARPGFSLPAGRFIDPRTGKRVPHGVSDSSAYSGGPPTVDRFFPGGGARAKQFQTGGIQGRHFIEPAFTVLARDYPIALRTLFDKWVARAGAGVKPHPV